jgi:hypothetical protein
LEEGISAARRHLIRDAAIYTPVFVFCLAVWAIVLAGAISEKDGRAAFFLVLLTILLVLFGFQSVQALRDLRSQPAVAEGPVRRKWRRVEFLLFPAHYIYVDKSIFKVPEYLHNELREGDLVAVTHFPHTATVANVTRLRHADR